jgi:hypothetical protein
MKKNNKTKTVKEEEEEEEEENWGHNKWDCCILPWDIPKLHWNIYQPCGSMLLYCFQIQLLEKDLQWCSYFQKLDDWGRIFSNWIQRGAVGLSNVVQRIFSTLWSKILHGVSSHIRPRRVHWRSLRQEFKTFPPSTKASQILFEVLTLVFLSLYTYIYIHVSFSPKDI